MGDRSLTHQQRIVDLNNNSTYSKIILPTFKDIWDFQDQYNGIDVTVALKQVSQKLHKNSSVVLHKYQTNGDVPSTAITVYTMESFVYKNMNKALRADNIEILKLFAPYIYQLINGLNNEQNYAGAVYRGIQIPKHLISYYTKDTVFFWPGFTSSTQDKQVAQHWPASNCLFEITIPKRFSYSCANIDHLSVYQTEKEVLIQPYSCYRVLSNKYDNNLQKNVIKLIIEATCYNLSGIWSCHDTQHNVNDAGVYFIAQYGQKVYWFGRKDKAYWDFVNVGYGTITSVTSQSNSNDDDNKNNNDNDVLSIKWSDLPIANDRYASKLKLKISSDYQNMTTIYNQNGIFWGNKWEKKSNIYLDEFKLNIDNLKWKGDNKYSGIWKGNYGGIYIISITKIDGIEYISWIGYALNMSWAHVAFGVIQNNKINVDWGDLLIGMDRYNGKLECQVESNNKIVMKKSTPSNIFLTTHITKQY